MLSVGDDDWSAFEHTITPLTGGLSAGSFLSIAPWNSRHEGLNRGSYLSSLPAVQNEHFSLSEMQRKQIPASLQNDANSAEGSLSKMLTSGSAIVISDDDGDDGEKPCPVVSCTGSQLTTDILSERVNITSTEVRILKDINRFQNVDSHQALQGHNMRNSSRKDQFCINKPFRGKENTQPPSDSQSELLRLNAKNCFDLERQLPYTVTQELGSANQWRSPLRLTVSNAKNDRLAESQSLQPDGLKVSDMNEGFSALSVASNDSFDSCVDQHSQSKFSEGSLNAEVDEVQVYKRTSSTPVKDRSSQPVRFRHQQHRNSSDEDSRDQRKSSLQSLHEMQPQAIAISQSCQDEKSLTSQAVQRIAMQAQADMVDPVHAAQLSVRALSTNSSFDDSVMISDITYESTVLLPLPTRGTDSAHLQQETGYPEVGTQTSFLSSTYSVKSKDASCYQTGKQRHSQGRKTNAQLLTSGNR